MSNCDRSERTEVVGPSHIVAGSLIGAALFIFGAISAITPQTSVGGDEHAKADYCAGYKDAYQIHRKMLGLGETVDNQRSGESNSKTSDHPNYIECRDLTAQESMSDSTADLVGIAWGQIILSIIGLGLLIWNGWLIKDANKIARKASSNQSRAYLSVDETEFTNDEGAVQIFPVLRNSGQTPAKNIRVAWRQGDSKKQIGILPPFENSDFKNFGSIGANTIKVINTHTVTIGFDFGRGKTYAIDGEVRYETIFGESYFSYFGFTARTDFMNPDKVIVVPMQGNMPVFEAFKPNGKRE